MTPIYVAPIYLRGKNTVRYWLYLVDNMKLTKGSVSTGAGRRLICLCALVVLGFWGRPVRVVDSLVRSDVIVVVAGA
jgi:hypothetical protein